MGLGRLRLRGSDAVLSHCGFKFQAFHCRRRPVGRHHCSGRHHWATWAEPDRTKKRKGSIKGNDDALVRAIKINIPSTFAQFFLVCVPRVHRGQASVGLPRPELGNGRGKSRAAKREKKRVGGLTESGAEVWTGFSPTCGPERPVSATASNSASKPDRRFKVATARGGEQEHREH